MTTSNDDLQDFLDGTDPLSEMYGQREPLEPPAALDTAILDAARTHAQQPARPRWLVPVSLAATVVLGVGLTLRQFPAPVADTTIEMSVPEPVLTAPATRPKIEEILAREAEADFAPTPIDVEQLRDQAQSAVPRPQPTLRPPPIEAEAPGVFARSEAQRKSSESVEAAAARVQRRLAGRRSDAADALANVGASALGSYNDAAGDDPLDGVVRALQENRTSEARAELAQRHIDEHGDLVSATLARIRVLHAEGDIATAQGLLDLLVEIVPDATLPADLPVRPSATR